jgi:hypothetical protein
MAALVMTGAATILWKMATLVTADAATILWKMATLVTSGAATIIFWLHLCSAGPLGGHAAAHMQQLQAQVAALQQAVLNAHDKLPKGSSAAGTEGVQDGNGPVVLLLKQQLAASTAQLEEQVQFCLPGWVGHAPHPHCCRFYLLGRAGHALSHTLLLLLPAGLSQLSPSPTHCSHFCLLG